MTLPEDPGCVYVVATPIGNLEDLSPRAVRILQEVSLIACEDTRHTARLCSRFAIGTRRVSLHAHNEARRTPGLLERVRAGESIALVSDAGTPLLSDPGARLVRAASEAGLTVVPVPGASAVLAALVASGLPTAAFTFLGFPPRRGGARRDWLASAARAPGTLVIFEAPGRASATLRDLYEALGPRRAVIARELTKRFEQVVRGRLGEIEPDETRGEMTLVVEGGTPGESGVADDADVDAQIRSKLERGTSARDTAAAVAAQTGRRRSEVYARVLGLRDGGGEEA
ncbi:MAG: 16S rRNA (cytidine(1402)-2'-O)-methyltransferase [Deltaproteobacteria bacterium]|nr:16S rRNA (cytidine(1402)-2'-O)-methyltransferase [Deltaproteobacteria bacterium]MBW2414588.1 16S rRNA (cytidine(1402)-2'-O)-methyltransferase [Deltaproteobacteria bacterium]